MSDIFNQVVANQLSRYIAYNGELGTDINIEIDDPQVKQALTNFLLEIGADRVNYLKDTGNPIIKNLDNIIASAVKDAFIEAIGSDNFTVKSNLYLIGDAFDKPPL